MIRHDQVKQKVLSRKKKKKKLEKKNGERIKKNERNRK